MSAHVASGAGWPADALVSSPGASPWDATAALGSPAMGSALRTRFADGVVEQALFNLFGDAAADSSLPNGQGAEAPPNADADADAQANNNDKNNTSHNASGSSGINNNNNNNNSSSNAIENNHPATDASFTPPFDAPTTLPFSGFTNHDTPTNFPRHNNGNSNDDASLTHAPSDDAELFQSILARLEELDIDQPATDPSSTPNAGNGNLSSNAPSSPPLQPQLLPQRPGARDCAYYLRTGTCAFGARCRFHHPRERELAQRARGSTPPRGIPGAAGATALPQRPGEPACQFFIRTGSCRFGAGCKFDHPLNIANRGDGLGPAADGADGSPPSSGPPSTNSVDGAAATLNALGLPLRPGVSPCAYYMRHGTCRYGSTCRYHHPERSVGTCVPCAPGSWGEGGAAGESFSPGGMPVLGGMDGAGMPDGESALSHLARRPGATPCPFYLRTGQCKFGATCRFDHPEDRVAIAAQHGVMVTRLGPLGLPLRPGNTPCPFYLKTGRCKFGVTCKYDHPVWEPGAPSMPMADVASPGSGGLYGSSPNGSAAALWDGEEQSADEQDERLLLAEANLDKFLDDVFA